MQHTIAAASFNPLGVLTWLYVAVAWLIMQIHSALSHVFGPNSGWAWGLTIVFLTVIVRLLLFPLFVKQIHAQRKMADLAPKVQEIRKKYKNDKQKMNQEVMTLYRENGANPLGGCLPLVAQLPVFIALFTVLREIADWTAAQGKPKYGLTVAVVHSAQSAHIFGVTVATRFISNAAELAKQDVGPVTAKVVIGFTVLVSGVTTYLTVRQSTRRNITPGAEDNPMMQSQKMMGYVAPLFALTGLYWQFGLVMYWVTTNLWTLGQQHYIYGKYPPQSAAAAEAGGAQGAGKQATGKQGTGRPVIVGKQGGGKQGGGKPGGTQAGGTQAGGGQGRGAKPAARGPATGGRSAGTAGAADGQGRPGLGRLLKGRSAPEPEPEAAPEPKLVRQQPVRQSRSKRTGKR
jgi:YidC/Oxa1 family membrane protein insertase